MVTYLWRAPVDDEALNSLHAAAFGHRPTAVPWSARLTGHSLGWVCALDGDALVGFVNVAWDGGTHAFVLDTAVRPDRQGRGIGRALVRRAEHEAREAACEWLHVDHEERLTAFYRACGFTPTEAGLLRL